jgi:hypothetical protein
MNVLAMSNFLSRVRYRRPMLLIVPQLAQYPVVWMCSILWYERQCTQVPRARP